MCIVHTVLCSWSWPLHVCKYMYTYLYMYMYSNNYYTSTCACACACACTCTCTWWLTSHALLLSVVYISPELALSTYTCSISLHTALLTKSEEPRFHWLPIRQTDSGLELEGNVLLTSAKFVHMITVHFVSCHVCFPAERHESSPWKILQSSKWTVVAFWSILHWVPHCMTHSMVLHDSVVFPCNSFETWFISLIFRLDTPVLLNSWSANVYSVYVHILALKHPLGMSFLSMCSFLSIHVHMYVVSVLLPAIHVSALDSRHTCTLL